MKNAPRTAAEASFLVNIRKSFEIRLIALGMSYDQMPAEQLKEEIERLMQNPRWIKSFPQQDEYVYQFRIAFKREFLHLATKMIVPESFHQIFTALPDVDYETGLDLVAEPEVMMAVTRDEEPAQDTAADYEAAMEPVMKQFEADIEECALTALATAYAPKFYAVEFYPEKAVGVPFDEINAARTFAQRRKKHGNIVVQVATAQQWEQRDEADSMLSRANLMSVPYEAGEPIVVPAPEPDKKAAKPAAVAVPAITPVTASEVTVAAPVLKPAPQAKEVALDAEMTTQQALNARLRVLNNLNELEQLLADAKEVGMDLILKSRGKAVAVHSSKDSTSYEGVQVVFFKYVAAPDEKIVSKSYAHALGRYYEIKEA